MQIKREVIVVDDDEAVRDSLKTLLEGEGFDVQTYASGSAFLEKVDLNSKGCLLLDIRMPDINGLEILESLQGKGAKLATIIITAYGDVPMAVRAMKIGATDFIQKPIQKEELLAGIKEAVRTETSDREAISTIESIRERLATLTPREREVFDQLITGNQNKMIAHDLGISPRTVEIHRARVMEKMQAKSLPDLVRIALAEEGYPE